MIKFKQTILKKETMKTLKDIIGLEQGNFTVATIGTHLFTLNELLDYFSKPIPEDEINDDTILSLYILINNFSINNPEYLNNVDRINTLFKHKYLDKLIKKNANLFQRMVREILDECTKSCQSEEQYLQVLNSIRTGAESDFYSKELLTFASDIETYLYGYVLNAGGNWQTVFDEYNSMENPSAELWYSISLQYMQSFYNKTKMISFLR